jgi:hypothetical protein
MCECSHHWTAHAGSGQTADSAACHGYTGSATPGPLREPCHCTGFREWAGSWDSRTGLPVKPLIVSTAPGDGREGRPGDPRAEAAARLGEAVNQAAAAIGAAFQPLVVAMAAALRALADDPVVRFVIEHPELLRAGRAKPCWCLCAKAHPGLAVCDGEGIATRRFTTEMTGPVDVSLCTPCAVAQGLTELADGPA